MLKKTIAISILVILSGILIPLVSNWGSGEWTKILVLGGIIAGLFILVFIYLKNPVFVLALIPAAIAAGQITTLRFRDWYYQISLAEILIIFLALAFFLQILIQNKWREIKFPGILLCLLLYLFFSLISFGWAENLSRAVIAIRSLLFHAAILFLAINLIKTKRDFKIALFALPLTALLVAGEVIFKVYSLGGFSEMIARKEIITPVGKWVYIAAIIILTLPLTYYLIFKVRAGLLKITLAIILGLGGLAVFLTLGKGEILATILGFSYLFWKQKLNKRILIPILIAIILITAIPFAQYAGKFWERIVNIADDPNTQFRVAEFYAASEIFPEHFALGVGAGNLKLAYKNLLPWSVESESNNFFLQVLLELGVVGFAILILIARAIYAGIKKARRHIKTQDQKLLYASFIATLIIVLLNAMVEATLIGLYYGIVFWYIVGLMTTCSKVYNPPNPPCQGGIRLPRLSREGRGGLRKF